VNAKEKYLGITKKKKKLETETTKHATQKWGKYSMSKLARYSWNIGHQIQWDEAQIMHRGQNRFSRKLK
jgi:hypothetical protein